MVLHVFFNILRYKNSDGFDSEGNVIPNEKEKKECQIFLYIVYSVHELYIFLEIRAIYATYGYV